MSKARIPFSADLIDESQPVSLKVTQLGNTFQLNITLGLRAEGIPGVDNPSNEIKRNYRDAWIAENLFLDGESNFRITKISDTEHASRFIFVIRGNGGTKIPGTGSGLRLIPLDNQLLAEVESK